MCIVSTVSHRRNLKPCVSNLTHDFQIKTSHMTGFAHSLLGQWTVIEAASDQSCYSACFYQLLRRLKQIRRRVGREVATRLVLALMVSRLDYCNSVQSGLPGCTVDVLQRVQNASARLIYQLKRSDHISSCPKDSHWLPVQSWTWVGSIHGSGRVGSRFFPYLVGWVGRVHLCGSVWVTLDYTKCYAKCNCKVYTI